MLVLAWADPTPHDPHAWTWLTELWSLDEKHPETIEEGLMRAQHKTASRG